MYKCKYCKQEIKSKFPDVDTPLKRACWMRLHIMEFHPEKVHTLAIKGKSWGDAIVD